MIWICCGPVVLCDCTTLLLGLLVLAATTAAFLAFISLI
jgi:hypothetical protein